MDIIQTFNERFLEWVVALLQHIQMSLVALSVAILIAVPIGILLFGHKKLMEVVLQLVGIFQTIPSLALLGLFIPFIGIGIVPSIVALVIYALFPILQGTLTGLSEIDSSLEEAATAFGMTKWEKLKTYQMPLAMPIVMASIRTATTMIIGTATLAALVGAGGLGTFILLGIDRNNTALIFIGAMSSALLAVLFSGVIKWMQHKQPKTILTSFIAVLLSVTISFIPLQQNKQHHLVIAGKLGAEPEILMNMYKLLIEEESNISVTLKPNFGKTTFLYEALKSGNIDVYPEFSGTIVTTLLNDKVMVMPTSDNDVYQLAKVGVLSQDNLAYLKPSEFQNTYALAVKKEFAQQYHLKTISDLKKVENQLIAGFSLEFNDRLDGNIGLKNIYHLNLNVKTMEPSLKYAAITNGDINVVEVYSTDSKIVTNNLVLLEDDLKMFPIYQVAPLLRVETLQKYPQLQPILEKLSNKITTQQMRDMNYKVDVESMSAENVAREFLKKEGLIK